jgi:ABC-type uncharacterized transport system ATPase subunit
VTADVPPLLELKGITKAFPGVIANDHVDFELRMGEVHALLGENGAGKSTLMNILYGLYHPDEGELRLNGSPLRISSPREAIDAGIGMVHQHFMLIPVMTVAENIVLAAEPKKGPFLDEQAAEARVRELSQRFGLAVRPDARIDSISVGMQQRAEILKALYRGAEILILDEPTAVLTPQEAKELFEIIRSLQADGKSIIFISHKLNEVLEIADRITVLRLGKNVDTVPSADRRRTREAHGRSRSRASRRETAGSAGRAAFDRRGPRCSRRQRSGGLPGSLVRIEGGRDSRNRGRRWQWPNRADRCAHGTAPTFWRPHNRRRDGHHGCERA